MTRPSRALTVRRRGAARRRGQPGAPVGGEAGAGGRGRLTNDLGIDFEDPNAWDDFTSPILKIPVNRPAVLNIGSKDVIHNYAIVPMRIQQDAIPGREIPMWFTPIKTLETYVVCAQLCGEGHGNMIGTMEVVDSKAFDTWSTGQSDEALKVHKK
jgi:cytochrome c oxidase subunit 2